MSQHIKAWQRAIGVTADGQFGPQTLAASMARLGPVAPIPAAPRPVTGLSRIILHWTAGGGFPTATDREHYHFLIDREGHIAEGDLPPSANIATNDGEYAAHTLNCNTGSIGIAFCGMMGAIERPFSPGPSPMTHVQIDAGCELVVTVAAKYGIPITPQTVLTHAEVQPTLGIAQRGKWDITWLPGMKAPADPVAVGNMLRAIIKTKGQ